MGGAFHGGHPYSQPMRLRNAVFTMCMCVRVSLIEAGDPSKLYGRGGSSVRKPWSRGIAGYTGHQPAQEYLRSGRLPPPPHPDGCGHCPAHCLCTFSASNAAYLLPCAPNLRNAQRA